MSPNLWACLIERTAELFVSRKGGKELATFVTHCVVIGYGKTR